MDKVVATAAEAVADVPDGASLAVGGFGLSGVPNVLIQALYERGVSGLPVVSNNCGALESGLAVLLSAGRIVRVTGSYIGEQGVRAALSLTRGQAADKRIEKRTVRA
jgi:3-oxoacid CoA-transferase subunit A